MTDVSRFVQPAWYLPVCGDPVRDPVLDLQVGQIVTSRDVPASRLVQRMDNCLVLPGLVNAHTHLDLSVFDRPVGRWGISFAEWVGEIIRYRQTADGNPLETAAPDDSPAGRGLRMSAQFGVAAIGNIVGIPWGGTIPGRDAVQVTSFFEQLGIDPETAEVRLEKMRDWLDGLGPAQAFGISPHAPYSLSVPMLAGSIRMAVERGIPVAMHLAESREERELLATGTGGLVATLRAAGVWVDSVEFPSIPFCLNLLARCLRSLVVHGNYLNGTELDMIAAQRDRMTVVWCPRTHDWFDHDDWPLKEISRRGIRIALGTDSLASSPDLDLLAEMQFVAARNPGLVPREVLAMGTRNGWAALGVELPADPRRLPPVMTGLVLQEPVFGDPESAVLGMSAVRRWVVRCGAGVECLNSFASRRQK